jgi:hypothetical protein
VVGVDKGGLLRLFYDHHGFHFFELLFVDLVVLGRVGNTLSWDRDSMILLAAAVFHIGNKIIKIAEILLSV